MADDVPETTDEGIKTEAVAQKLMRGAKATPRHVLARAMPFRRRAAAPPPEFARLPKKKNVWYNSTYGICVTSEECCAKSADNPNVYIKPDDMLVWATQHGFRDGAYLTEVMDAMTEKGIKADDGKVYNDGKGRRAVDWTNRADLMDAIHQGTIKIAVAADNLENAGAGNKDGWMGLSFYVDHHTDHCVSLVAYGSIRFLVDELNKAYGLSLSVPSGVDPKMFCYALFTWGTVGIVSEKSMINITDEAWLRVPTTDGFGPTPDPDPPGPNPDPPGPTPPGPVELHGKTDGGQTVPMEITVRPSFGRPFKITIPALTVPSQGVTVEGLAPPVPTPTPSGLDATKVEMLLRNAGHTAESLGLTPQQWQMIIQLILQLLPIFFPPKPGASTAETVGKLTPEQWAAIIQLILKLLPLIVGG